MLFMLAALPLAGCGFTPVYGTGGAADGLTGRILVAAPKNRVGYELAGRLEERLGRTQTPDFKLSYAIKTSAQGVTITSSQSTTRYNLSGDVSYTLVDQATGALLTSGAVNSFTGYSAAGTTVATSAAETDAYNRLMIILADQIVARLLATAESWAE
ncbi:LPS assembly lipoprotein LptE [Actibacterium lipolyticum]|uniref:LPS-assembly lipoprotein n=1 Tax=Actibacterium lipolyticum TaxID=1524263 RepID=A0A238KUM6_9RHOB|nr:LPS assembly lipoprotein LptE [Actibacterium lipolyticum]SMX46350.1 hypothetical protein COL8621_03071 [Actibacterium lipolyticum]